MLRGKRITDWDVQQGHATSDQLELQQRVTHERQWRFANEFEIRMEMERAVDRRMSPDGIARAASRRALGN